MSIVLFFWDQAIERRKCVCFLNIIVGVKTERRVRKIDWDCKVDVMKAKVSREAGTRWPWKLDT